MGVLSWGVLSYGGFVLGGFCPGGGCPRGVLSYTHKKKPLDVQFYFFSEYSSIEIINR